MRNAYALCLFAGLREGECLGLSWKQVDFEQGTVMVEGKTYKMLDMAFPTVGEGQGALYRTHRQKREAPDH